jgi:drug/metabolite transporter (DMT)-like permease
MSARAWTAFAAVSTLWGIPYLFIKIAVDDGVPPIFLAWARVLMAAVVLLALSHRAGVLRPVLTRERVRWLAVYAVLEIVIPFPLIAAGEQHVDSSLAAILIAAVPIFVALLAIRFDHRERVTGARAVGLAIGFAGVVALVGLDVSGSSEELLGALAILLAAVGYAAGPMILNRHLSDVDPRAFMAVALSIAAVVLTIPALLKPPAQAPGGDALASIVVLGLFCTAAAFVLFGALIAEVGPSRASVITYVSPIVAVALGVAVLHERPGAGAIAGVLLILAGSWLSTDGRLPPGISLRIARARGRFQDPPIPDRQPDVADRLSRSLNPMSPLRLLLAAVLVPGALFLSTWSPSSRTRG